MTLCSTVPCKQEDFPAYQPEVSPEDSIPSSSPSPPQETDEESDGNRKEGRDSGREWDSKRGERDNGEGFHVDKEAKSPIRKANEGGTEAVSSRYVRTPTDISQEVLHVSKSGSKKKVTEERRTSRSGVTNSTDQDSSNVTTDADEGKNGERNQGRDVEKSGVTGITDSRPSSSSRSSRKAAGAIADAAKMAENTAKIGLT